LIHEVLSQVSKDTGRNSIAITNLCIALSIVINQMNDGPDKDKATAHIEAVRSGMTEIADEQR
jgi:hypothetical protein